MTASTITRMIMKRIVCVLLTFHAMACIGGLPFVEYSSVKGPDSHIRLLTTACDVGVSLILQPDSGVNLSSAEMVAVRINNFGTQPQSHFPVSYCVGTGPVVTEQVAITIPAGGNIVYTFSATADLSSVGTTYLLTAWTSLGCDTISQNDTAWKQVANMPAVYCSSTALLPGGAEITQVEIIGYVHSSCPAGTLYSDLTAQLPPVNLIRGGDYTLRITTTSFPGSTTPAPAYLKAWIDFNRNGVFDTASEQIVSQHIPADTMIQASFTVPLLAYPGASRLRIVLQQTQLPGEVAPCGTYTYGETEDYGVALLAAVPCDAGIREVIQPGNIVEPGVPIPIEVLVRNYGTASIPASELFTGFSLNGGNPQIYPYTGNNLPSGTEQQVALPPITIPHGNNRLCVFSQLSCDIYPFNNNLCFDVYGAVHAALPCNDSFDKGNYWYHLPGVKNWQLGTPAKPLINTPFGGSNAWVTKLNGNYSTHAHEHLWTPFFDFSPVPPGDTVMLVLRHWCAMDTGDYGTVAYSADSGLTWNPLGHIGDPSGDNWFNFQAGQSEGFSHTNSGWITSSYKLSPSVFNGNANVRFRFTFHSDSAGTSDGWAIDNFSLMVPPVPADVGVTNFVYPLNDTAAGSIVSGITVKMTNYGTLPQTQIPLQLRLDGVIISTIVFSDTLHPGDTIPVTFPGTYTAPANSYTLTATTLLQTDPYAGNDSVSIVFQAMPAYTDAKISFLEPGSGFPEPVIIRFHLPSYPDLCVYPVSVRIENAGQLPMDSIPLKYRFHNGGLLYQHLWIGTLPPGGSVDITLPDFFKPYPGLQKVTVFMDLPGNLIPSNDTTSREFMGQISCLTSIDGIDAEPVSNLRNVPNPASDQSDIVFSLLRQGTVTVKLSNLTGKVLQSITLPASEGENRVAVDLTGLANGMYIYSLEFEGRRVSAKMVIQR
jgi:hypothetical protein